MPAHTDALNQDRDTVGIWVGMTGLSILCHILFFSGVMFLPESRFNRMSLPSAVEVDLVSLPQAASRQQPGSRQAPRPRTEPVKTLPAAKLQTKKEAVSTLLESLRVKKSLKQKTYNASNAIRGAIDKIEKDADQSRPRPVLQAIGKLKEKVESHEGIVFGGGLAKGSGSKKAIELLDIYNAEIWHRIQKNWAFSKEMVRGRTDLEATIIVKILRGGEIRDIWFEKRSGLGYFDDSVFKAVRKSDPLPPLPEGYLGTFYEVGFRFNLSELRRGF